MPRKRFDRQLRLEQLEDRNLLAIFIASASADDGTGQLNTLSRAILDANAASDEPHTIAITAAKIDVTGSLPMINARSVTIEGDGGIRRQINSNGAIFGIRYNGAANSLAGLFTVRDLDIYEFANGIHITSLSADDQIDIRDTYIHNNTENGIFVQQMPSGSTGKVVIEDNVIWGNAGAGIAIDRPTGDLVTPTMRSSIRNNDIGLNNSGAAAGNGREGVFLGRHVNSIDVASNSISFNGRAGIALAPTAGTGNSFHANYFRDNTGIPIDLNDDGVSLNDPGDGDSGPNNLLNHPVIKAGEIEQLDDPTFEWAVPLHVDFDIIGPYAFQVYQYFPATDELVYKQETSFGGGVGQGSVTLSLLSSLGLHEGDQIRVNVRGGSGTGGNNQSTSEFSPIATLAVPPRITDILLDGSTWARDPYSYAEIVPTGKQLAPIFTQGVNTLQVQFSEHVLLDGSEMALHQWGTAVLPPIEYDNFSYDVGTHVATWTFDDPLPARKFRLELSNAIVDVAGNMLDGEWENRFGVDGSGLPTYDDFSDDPAGRTFLSGNGVEGGAFQLMFSYLPGDYNQDGVVNSDDLLVSADGDGDGVAGTSADDAIVTANLNARLTASTRRGDYHDNEIVDLADYMVWKMTYGSQTDLRADGNANGTVDAADYSVWADNKNSVSAWYPGPLQGFGSGSGTPVVNFGAAPQVTDVIISGSSSTHAPYSFDDQNADGSGEQLRTVPVGGADSISITFSEDVNLVASDLTLVGMQTATRPELAEFNYDVLSMTATWRFGTIVIGDQYLISLRDTVSDVEGNPLDGEWTNPASLFTTNSLVSTFPSGDGNAGGTFNFVFTILPGDRNRNNIVSHPDQEFEYELWTEWEYGNFNGDGMVDQSDMDLLNANYGLNLQNLLLLADLNGDWAVTQADLDILYYNWDNDLQNPTEEDGDLNGDGVINIDDLDLAFAQLGMELSVVS